MASQSEKQDRIYLDHNATTPVDPGVLEAMLPWLAGGFGNASSIHAEGRAARSAVDKARRQVAELLGASEDEIYFTSGGTEADNLAIFGAVEATGKTSGTLITTPVEHNAALRPMQRLEQRGFKLRLLGVDDGGRVDPAELERLLDANADVLLVSVIMANNEVGTVQPVDELAELCKARGVTFHTDAVQAAGKLPIDLGKTPASMLCISGHKIYAPKGIGALFIRRGTKVLSRILGGTHERKLRAGTENVSGIVALGEACRIAGDNLIENNQRIAALRDRMWDGLSGKLEGVHFNGSHEYRTSNTLNVSFDGVEGEALLLNLDIAGISCSAGSACASGALEPSHVLTAMKVPQSLAQASVRFSLGKSTTAEQIGRAVDEIVRVVTRLRELRFNF